MSLYAANAILAGNDMVFISGDSSKTYRVFQNLLYISCQNTKNGQSLRNRIEESYGKIKNFKMEHEKNLRNIPEVPSELIDLTIEMLAKSSRSDHRNSEHLELGCLSDSLMSKWIKQVKELGIVSGPNASTVDAISSEFKNLN